MKTRTLAVLAGSLLLAGGVAAIAAVGERGGWRGHGPGMGQGWQAGEHRGRGMRARDITKDDADARTRERFARLDKNSDGFIDATEIETALAGRMGRGQGMRGQMGQRLIQRFDENRDGKVTKEEFANYLKKQFARADLNNDGRIGDDDLPPMMRGRNALSGDGGMMMGRGGRRGGMGGEPGFSWLRGADANKDGVITQDEAIGEGMKRFTQLDRTKDGAVDQADFDAMRKDMADYRVKRFIHRFGADRDGKVSREQFFKEAAERFALADLNNDGRITRDEMGRGGGRHGRGHHRGGEPGAMGRGPGLMGPGQPGPGGPGRN
jgi:Ca2+-binding EF-hand superfamily protein